jgi:hypothetical protein
MSIQKTAIIANGGQLQVACLVDVLVGTKWMPSQNKDVHRSLLSRNNRTIPLVIKKVQIPHHKLLADIRNPVRQ